MYKHIFTIFAANVVCMDYQKITFRLPNVEDYMSDLLVATLGEIGFDSFEETTQGLIGYCPAPIFSEKAMKEAINTMIISISYSYSITFIADQNWNETWEQNSFDPIEIDTRCVIHSSQKPVSKIFTYDIIINPKQAFGTGTHETTRMMLEFLLENDLKNKDVLDMGCGTGVLSIMASLRGANSIESIDIDNWSHENTLENIALNSLKNITVILGDASLLTHQQFHLILANINRNILLNDMVKYVQVLVPQGLLVMSGFYKNDYPLIQEKAERLGLKQVSYQENNEWMMGCFMKIA